MSAQKPKKRSQINLLPRDRFATSSVGRILSWLLSTFRIIVIIVEMIVMGAFLSRFWLDAKNSDLNDEITQKKALIAASKDFEKEFKNTQLRLEALATLTKIEQPFSKLLAMVPPLLPPEIILKSFTANQEGILVSGTSPSEQIIAQLIANLESNSRVENIYLSQLGTDKDDESLLEFGLTVTIKKGE